MSQAGSFSSSGGGGGSDIQTVTGNSGGAVGPDGAFNINIIGSGVIDVVGNPGTNTLTISATITATDYVADVGMATPAASILNVLGGSNMNTSGAGNTLTINLNDFITWPDANALGTTGVIYLNGISWLHNYSSIGPNNIFLGKNAGNFTNSGGVAIGIGQLSFNSLTTGSGVAIGDGSQQALTTGIGNDSFGSGSLSTFVSGDWNISIGSNSLWRLISGNTNIVLGTNTFAAGNANNRGGDNYTSSETANILINNAGVTGESNTIRIGTFGADIRSQNRCFIAGIFGINPTTVNAVPMFIASDGQIGTLGAMTNGQLIIGSTGVDPVISTLTAGTNISIVNAPGSITINSTGGTIFGNYTDVTTDPYVVTATDYYLSVNTGIAITVQLPNAPTTNRTFIIKDRTGTSAANNITVTTVGGVVNIDGAATFTMNTNYQAISLLFNGTSYEIF